MILADPPTEIEIAEALDFLPRGGAIPGVDKCHEILRRLAFDRDRLKTELARAENLIDTLAVALRQWADAHKTTEGPKP